MRNNVGRHIGHDRRTGFDAVDQHWKRHLRSETDYASGWAVRAKRHHVTATNNAINVRLVRLIANIAIIYT